MNMSTVFLASTQCAIITDSFYQMFPLQYLNIAKHRKKFLMALKPCNQKKSRPQEIVFPFYLRVVLKPSKGQVTSFANFVPAKLAQRGSLYESDKFSRCYNKRLPLHFFTEQLEAHALNNYMRGPGHYPRKAQQNL